MEPDIEELIMALRACIGAMEPLETTHGACKLALCAARTAVERVTPAKMKLHTLCTNCQKPIVLCWPAKTTWAGVEVTAQEYLENALRSESKVWIVCDVCLGKMPDVKLEDIIGGGVERE